PQVPIWTQDYAGVPWIFDDLHVAHRCFGEIAANALARNPLRNLWIVGTLEACLPPGFRLRHLLRGWLALEGLALARLAIIRVIAPNPAAVRRRPPWCSK